MRQRLAAGLVILATASWGCGLDVVEFDIVEEGGVGLAGVSLPGLQGFANTLGSALAARDIKPGDVDSLRLLSGRLEMLSQGGLTKDLAFIARLDFLVGASGLSPTLLAHTPPPDPGQRRVELEVQSQLELQPYLAAGDMVVEADAQLDPPPPDLVELRLTFHMRVDVNL